MLGDGRVFPRHTLTPALPELRGSGGGGEKGEGQGQRGGK